MSKNAARGIGLVVPQRGLFIKVFSNIREIVDLCQYADNSGRYDALWVGDSVLVTPRPESLTLLAALSTVTRSAQLGVACLGTFPIRDPILLASQTATLDQMSNGRFLLTVCSGIKKAQQESEKEGAPYGIKDSDRVKILEENIEILRLLWSENVVSFEGQYHRFSNISIRPKPIQDSPSIFIASQPKPGPTAERSLRRVARFGDGWMTARKSPDIITANLEALRSYLADEGRESSGFPVVAYHNVNLNSDRDAAIDETTAFTREYYGGAAFTDEETGYLTAAGSVEQVLVELDQLFNEGATQIAIRLTTWDWKRQLHTLTEEVIPALL